jgi:hypothetical protein
MTVMLFCTAEDRERLLIVLAVDLPLLLERHTRLDDLVMMANGFDGLLEADNYQQADDDTRDMDKEVSACVRADERRVSGLSELRLLVDDMVFVANAVQDVAALDIDKGNAPPRRSMSLIKAANNVVGCQVGGWLSCRTGW